MRAIYVFMVLGVAAGCGPSRGSNDSLVDASASGGDGGTTTETSLTCVDLTRTFTTSDGSKTVVTHRWAVLEDVKPTDDFTVITCHSTNPFDGPCPANSTCTGTVTPPGQVCFTAHDAPQIGGRLYVSCGAGSTEYAPDGSVRSTSSRYAESIKVHR